MLDLYRTAPGDLSAAQRRDVVAAADTGAMMLLGQQTSPAEPGDPEYPGSSGGWLHDGLGHRAEVHQATGMVLVQLGINATDALARLRAHAFAHHRLVIDIARDVVNRRLVFTEEVS